MKIGNKSKGLLAILLSVALLFTTTPINVVAVNVVIAEFAGGSGTEADPYLISTKEHLDNMRNHLSKFSSPYFKLTNDIVFNDSDFVEGGEYWNEGNLWLPIGHDTLFNFSGTLDGNGFSIINLKINGQAVEFGYIGLFSKCAGTIKNLSLENAQITVSGAQGPCFVGGFAGELSCYISGSSEKYGMIENCSFSGNITTTSDDFLNYAGGIVGSTSHNHKIINCHNYGRISSQLAAGGIVYSNGGLISNCSNHGEIVILEEPNSSFTTNSGGICSSNSGTIECCYNAGTVNNYANCGYDGGIAGENRSLISDCYNTATIRGGSVGGIVGDSMYGTTQKCYNIATLEGTYRTGGIVSYMFSGSVENCYYRNGEGLGNFISSLELQNQNSLLDFDFSSIWEFAEGNLYKYPTLKGNSQYILSEDEFGSHIWDDGIITKSPTCTEGGSITYTCLLCGEAKSESNDMTGHTAVVDPAISASCTESGKTEGSHCGVCGLTIIEQDDIPAFGHNAGEWEEDDHNHWHTCTTCGTLLDISGHSYDDDQDTVCNDCGHVRAIVSTADLIKSIQAEKISLIENISGYRDGQSGCFVYDLPEYKNITVTLNDGTILNMDRDSYAFIIDSQYCYVQYDSFDTSKWTAGHTYTVTAKLCEKEFSIDVEIIANPYLALTLEQTDDLYLVFKKKDGSIERHRAVSLVSRLGDQGLIGGILETDKYEFPLAEFHYYAPNNGYPAYEKNVYVEIGDMTSNTINDCYWLKAQSLKGPYTMATVLYRWYDEDINNHIYSGYNKSNYDLDAVITIASNALLDGYEYETIGNRNYFYVSTYDVNYALQCMFGLTDVDLTEYSLYDSNHPNQIMVLGTYGGFGPNKTTLTFENGQWDLSFKVLEVNEPYDHIHFVLDEQFTVQSIEFVDEPDHEEVPEFVRENEIAPTCCSEGYYDEVAYCSICGELISRKQIVIPIDADAHDWGEWVQTKAPTETEAGEETRTCKNDPSHRETREIAPLGPLEIELSFLDNEIIIVIPDGSIPDNAEFDVQKIVPPPEEVIEKVKDQVGSSSEVITYYKIRLSDTAGTLIVHLDGEITIKMKMPEQHIGSKCVRMLQEDETGNLITMTSWWEDEYLCYKTDWLEIYN